MIFISFFAIEVHTCGCPKPVPPNIHNVSYQNFRCALTSFCCPRCPAMRQLQCFEKRTSSILCLFRIKRGENWISSRDVAFLGLCAEVCSVIEYRILAAHNIPTWWHCRFALYISPVISLFDLASLYFSSCRHASSWKARASASPTSKSTSMA